MQLPLVDPIIFPESVDMRVRVRVETMLSDNRYK